MPIVHWQDRYETGIQVIDDQHRQLFTSINALFDALQTGASPTEIAPILDFLLAYSVSHFQTEESVMAEHGYPGLADHREDHARLISRVRDFRDRFETAEPPTTLELAHFVRAWMSHHVSEVDMGYAAFVKGRQ